MSQTSSAELLRTPLYENHKKLDARLVEFGGWEMPLSYEGQLAEHQAVRNGVGMFDVSHMGQVRLTGPRVLEFIQKLVPGDFSTLENGKAKYTQLCNEAGGVLDDLIITRLAATDYFAVVNAGTRVKDIAWIVAKSGELGFGDLKIVDESNDWGMIAVQGPEAFTVLDKLIPGYDWASTPAFTMHSFEEAGKTHLFSRTGYTGEVGAELIVPAELAGDWWERLLDAGVKPCGLAARDTLRLEAGYCLYGNDLDETTSPVEAAIGWSVGWKKSENYIGREVIDRHKSEGASRRLVGLQTETRRPLRHGDAVLSGDEEVGVVTSGGFSPILQVGIALAYVKPDAIKAGNLQIKSRSAVQPARVVKPPFVKTSLSKK